VVRDRDGYAPIRDYAAIGDGRTIALVALDGSIDWLAWPNLDSPSIFGALLDAERGGRCSLAPTIPSTVTRRYVPDTNVLETTFATDRGIVRVTDALVFAGPQLGPLRELVRSIDSIEGDVPMGWIVEPRFGYGARRTWIRLDDGLPVASSGSDAVAIHSFGAGRPEIRGDQVVGSFDAAGGANALVVLAGTSQEPLVFPWRGDVLDRLHETERSWRDWTTARPYTGPFREAVLRSGLALRLLVFAPSGAIAGAGTTSLPEEVGGIRNWDYRFSWIRDSALTLEALIALGCPEEAEAYFWWLMQASRLADPDVQVLYRLDGGAHARERTLDLAGYRGSRPVRVGNAAVDQRQLDIYGDLLSCAWMFTEAVGELDPDIGRRLARVADVVCDRWQQPDSGIWEVRSAPRHYTQSKMMCWIALDRAIALADARRIPSTRAGRWARERDAIARFVEDRCWSEELRSYVRWADASDLDASVLHATILGYGEPRGPRIMGTLAAIDRELREGPFVKRYLGDDGLEGDEGAFLACSFWLADAWARAGHIDRAVELLEELAEMANDVGLYAEEVDPVDRSFLGNFPQALSHLALIGAASAIDEARRSGA
jgi:GH15 family glucan-1,4-alpha-glucosidase